MAHVFKNLSFALVMFVTAGAAASARAEIVINGNIELPYLLNRSDILGNADVSHDTLDALVGPPSLERRLQQGHGIAAGEAVVPELLPVIASLDAPVIDADNSADESVAKRDDEAAPRSGPEPYVMLLIGLGLIVLAITLHLKPIQPPRSGFKPSQGMPFV